MNLDACNELPFVDRPNEHRIQVLETVGLFGGHVQNYSTETGGLVVAMPTNRYHQGIIREFLELIGLEDTGWRMDVHYPYSQLEQYKLAQEK